MSDVKEKYADLAKNHKVPSFEELNKEFEIEDVDDDFMLKNILRKIAEKLESYINLLGEILQPDANSISSMHEAQFFSDDERRQSFEIYRKLMKAYRSIIESLLKNEEAEQAELLNVLLKSWKESKTMLIPLIAKMKESWDKDITIKENIGYFG